MKLLYDTFGGPNNNLCLSFMIRLKVYLFTQSLVLAFIAFGIETPALWWTNLSVGFMHPPFLSGFLSLGRRFLLYMFLLAINEFSHRKFRSCSGVASHQIFPVIYRASFFISFLLFNFFLLMWIKNILKAPRKCPSDQRSVQMQTKFLCRSWWCWELQREKSEHHQREK